MSAELYGYTGIGIAIVLAVLRAATPILLAALGGMISELAGCINVALEGMMLVAAFFGVIGALYGEQWLPGSGPLLGCVAGLLAAVLLAVLLAVFHLELGADLIVGGIAINLLAGGLTVFLLATLIGDKGSTAGLNSPGLPSLHVPGLDGWPLLDMLVNGEAGRGQHVLLLAAFAAVALLAFFLDRSRYGTWMRAVGENRHAALAAGIPVRRVQYAALLLSGVLAGMGGLYLSMGYLNLFQADMTAGRGFLALAAVFLGGCRPRGVLRASLLFGAAAVLATRLGALNWPTQVVYMLPPLVTIGALVLAGRRQPEKF
jgi:general nucleoside transport system permease protein